MVFILWQLAKYHIQESPVQFKANIKLSDQDKNGIPDDVEEWVNNPVDVEVDEKDSPLDDDGDNVPNHLDICLDTTAGVKVDEQGCSTCNGVQASVTDYQFYDGKPFVDVIVTTCEPTTINFEVEGITRPEWIPKIPYTVEGLDDPDSAIGGGLDVPLATGLMPNEIKEFNLNRLIILYPSTKNGVPERITVDVYFG